MEYSLLGLNAPIDSLLWWDGKGGNWSKAGAVKCFKETKITAQPYECCNISLYFNSSCINSTFQLTAVPRNNLEQIQNTCRYFIYPLFYISLCFFWTILSTISSLTFELCDVGDCLPCWVAQPWPFHSPITSIHCGTCTIAGSHSMFILYNCHLIVCPDGIRPAVAESRPL